MKLTIGNKNYSSWSLRPWLVLRMFDIPFEEEQLWLGDTAEAKEALRQASPSARVPCLWVDEQPIWDSLAITEYVAERFPDKAIWPRDAHLRAHARCVSAEMHAGFSNLRAELPMILRRPAGQVSASPACQDDIARICTIWSECLQRYQGPFLFGSFCAADAFFAPVAWRFTSYAVPLAPHLHAYVDRLRALPPMQAWHAAALAEVQTLPRYDGPGGQVLP